MDETEAEQKKWDAAMDACAACGKKPAKLLRCSRCKACSYCSVKCQKVAYKRGHKVECKTIARDKETFGSSWSFTTHLVPRLPVEHPYSVHPNAAGAELAKQALESGMTPSQLEAFNPNLAAWMEVQCCLSQAELLRLSELLMQGNVSGITTDSLVLRTLLLMECSAAGQPTLEELLQLRIGSQSQARLVGTGITCMRCMLENNDRDEQIFCPGGHPNLLLDVDSSFGLLMLQSTIGGDLLGGGAGGGGGGGGDILAMMDRYLFGNPDPPQVAQVTNDFRRLFEAAGLIAKTGTIPIDAIFHATSFRVLMQAGVPLQWQNVRHTPHAIWEEVPPSYQVR